MNKLYRTLHKLLPSKLVFLDAESFWMVQTVVLNFIRIVRFLMEYLVAEFCQARVMSCRKDSSSSVVESGACHCFSISWLRKVLGHDSELPRRSLNRMKPDVPVGGIRTDLTLQGQFIRNYDPTPYGMETCDQVIFSARGLGRRRTLDCDDDGIFSWEKFYDYICHGNGGFLYSFCIDAPDGNQYGHSIAFYHAPVGSYAEFVLVFDANYGEFHVLPSKFLKFWFRLLTSHYRMPYTHFLRQVEITGKDNINGEPYAPSSPVSRRRGFS